jgi:hypothetical protein
MKKKKLYLILIILVLVICSSLALRCFGFQIGPKSNEQIDYEEMEIRWKIAKAKEAELEEGFEEEEELFPDEIITYHAQLTGAHYEHLEGLEITLKVNFKTLEVRVEVTGGEADKPSGFYNVSGEIVDIETLEVYAYGGDYSFIDSISGNISEDLNRFDGGILSQSISYGFTASR